MNTLTQTVTPSAALVGGWLLAKWQARLHDTGRDFQTVARQMRKQGYPLEVARAVLLGVGGSALR